MFSVKWSIRKFPDVPDNSGYVEGPLTPFCRNQKMIPDIEVEGSYKKAKGLYE